MKEKVDFAMTRHSGILVMGLILMCLAFNSAGAIEKSEVLILHFGSGARELGLFPPGEKTGGYMGPTSFAMDALNNIYVLDAAHYSVKVFSLDGILKQVIEYPPFTADGTPVLCVDLAVSPEGGIFVANQTENIIWKFSPAGKLTSTFGLKDDGSSYFDFLIKVDIDARGAIYAADRKAMKVFRLKPDGQKDKALPFNSCSVTYPDGSLVMLDAREETKTLAVKRLSPDISDIKHVGKLTLPKTVLDTYPIGVDAENNLYVFVSLGVMYGAGWKKAEAMYVLIVNTGGKLVKKIRVPEFSVFPLNRFFAVTGDGRLLRVETDEERFMIVEYR